MSTRDDILVAAGATGGLLYRPPNGNYPRPGYPPRPAPYPATRPANGSGGYNRPNNPAIPATRPYDKNSARPANPNIAKPSFPKASTLPNNPGGSNLGKNEISEESIQSACESRRWDSARKSYRRKSARHQAGQSCRATRPEASRRTTAVLAAATAR